MAFLSYKKTSSGGTLRYERGNPLKLSGTDGLIARHVRTLPAAQVASWKLGAPALLTLAGFEGDGFTVLFELTGNDATEFCLYELTCVHGSCRDTSTNLALDFNIMFHCKMKGSTGEFGAVFEAPLAVAPKKLGEMLAMTGGPLGGDWKWADSAVQLGATVVQPQPNHGTAAATAAVRLP